MPATTIAATASATPMGRAAQYNQAAPMSAPVSIAHTHVHSIRTATGLEALVARVLTPEGVAGFGFTLNMDAAVARDMAAWDAAARARGAPLYTLLGEKKRESVAVTDKTSFLVIDPFALGSLERTLAEAGTRSVALLASNGHPWEIAWCAATAAVLPGNDVTILTAGAPAVPACQVSSDPGIGIDWSLEPAFRAIRW